MPLDRDEVLRGCLEGLGQFVQGCLGVVGKGVLIEREVDISQRRAKRGGQRRRWEPRNGTRGSGRRAGGSGRSGDGTGRARWTGGSRTGGSGRSGGGTGRARWTGGSRTGGSGRSGGGTGRARWTGGSRTGGSGRSGGGTGRARCPRRTGAGGCRFLAEWRPDVHLIADEGNR